MTDSLALLDMFGRGVAVGAMAVVGLGFLGRGAGRDLRIAVPLASLSICCWLITESRTLWGALGFAWLLMVPAYPVGAMFWLFVVTAFADRPLTPLNWAPAAILMVTGFVCQFADPSHIGWLWVSRNVFSALLSLHAVIVIARGWQGDLLEARRRLRGLIMGFAALLALTNTLIGLVEHGHPHGAWLMWTAGEPYGGALFALVILAAASVFLQVRPVMFSAPRRTTQISDARAEAAERLMLEKLNGLMAADGWRQEGVTIGEVARRLGEPEHRVRRLINQRLGHRNFADFVNSFRIAAAKARLADPGEARTTVAAIAFDLGYGSLGPFNRAFRAATGASPTEWRREALQTSPQLREAV